MVVMADMMSPRRAFVCRLDGADRVVRKGQIRVVPMDRQAQSVAPFKIDRQLPIRFSDGGKHPAE
jgi:hypothetical protein